MTLPVPRAPLRPLLLLVPSQLLLLAPVPPHATDSARATVKIPLVVRELAMARISSAWLLARPSSVLAAVDSAAPMVTAALASARAMAVARKKDVLKAF